MSEGEIEEVYVGETITRDQEETEKEEEEGGKMEVKAVISADGNK